MDLCSRRFADAHDLEDKVIAYERGNAFYKARGEGQSSAVARRHGLYDTPFIIGTPYPDGTYDRTLVNFCCEASSKMHT